MFRSLPLCLTLMTAVAFYNIKDVRPTLKHYQGKDIAKEYAKVEEEQKKKATEEWERLHPNAITGAGSGFLTSIFGGVSSVSELRQERA